MVGFGQLFGQLLRYGAQGVGVLGLNVNLADLGHTLVKALAVFEANKGGPVGIEIIIVYG